LVIGRNKRFELTPDVWSIEGGQLTPTLKLKENSYEKIYQFIP
jgi:long-chain acyl-CoA synthetase